VRQALIRVILAGCLVFIGCAPAHSAPAPFTYLGQVDLAPGLNFDGTTVGGLSGMSYDPGRRAYYVISDDRSAENPARFYTARIPLGDSKLRDVEFTATTPWLDPSGVPFPPLSADATPPAIPPDPEGIAFDERRQQLYWSSEGERITEDPAKPLLGDPWVRIAGLDGRYRGQFTLPPELTMSANETGPRQNLALEALSLSPSGEFLFAGTEGPVYADGAQPTTDAGALSRITRFDVATGTPSAQFAYPLDPVVIPNGQANGLTDMLALDDENFLTIERAYGGGRVVIRIYRATVAGADNVLGRPSLMFLPPVAMTKTLVADLSTMPEVRDLDNVEGITFGPKLSDGRQSLLLVTDDNFSPGQSTQFFAFAV
jgi:hypothetical protein